MKLDALLFECPFCSKAFLSLSCSNREKDVSVKTIKTYNILGVCIL